LLSLTLLLFLLLDFFSLSLSLSRINLLNQQLKMPAWWGRKSSKNKEQQQQVVTEQNPLSNQLNPSNSSIKADKKKGKHKPKSLEDVLSRNSPRTSKDFGGAAASGLSFCDSDSGEKIGHPLPRPSISSGNDHIQGVVFGLGSGSGSVSSLSSSVSSEDHPVAQDQGQFGNFRLVCFCFCLFF
jgi:mitogen-activated protein kinase kinase kinase 3